MSQNDLVIANQSFPSFRTDLNSALQAIQTTHSGTSLPTGALAGQIWLDTTNATSPTLKFYDGTDSISLATINYTANTVDWLDSSVSITGLSTSATGTVLTLSDTAHTTTVNLILNNQTEIRFNELTANGTNYIGLKAPASLSSDLTYTLPTAPASNNRALISSTAGVMSYTPYSFPTSDGTASQVLQTNGSGVLSFASPSSGTNTPAFLVTRTTASQTIANNTATKVEFTNELYDTNSCFDSTTNYRFTPNVAGKYFLTATLSIYGTSAAWQDFEFSIKKNNTTFLAFALILQNTGNQFEFVVNNVSSFDDANGTTDYYECFVKFNYTSGSGSNIIDNSRHNINFGGFKLIT